MAQFQIYNFNSEIIQNNIFNHQLNQYQTFISNSRKSKKSNIQTPSPFINQFNQIQDYSIQKYKIQINPQALIIQNKKYQDHTDIQTQQIDHKIIRKQRDICDFAEQDCDQQINQFSIQNTQNQQKQKVRDIADFLQQEEEQHQQQQDHQFQLGNENQLQQVEDFKIQSECISQMQISMEKSVIQKQNKQYFVFDQYLFLKNHLSVDTQLKCYIKSQHNSNQNFYTFYMENMAVATCVNANGVFLFECNSGPIAKMEIINDVYQIFIFDDEIDMIQQAFASIYFANRLIQNKRFSSMEIYLSRSGGINRSPKEQFQKKKNAIKLFKSRNPYINQFGKLQLKIDNIVNVRPSNFNCIIQDNNCNQICSLFYTNCYEVNIKYPFNPLLGAACAIARLQWNNREKK